MGTPHTPSRTPRAATVPVRMTQSAVDKVDELRGTWTRSEYIRRAVAEAVKQNKKGPTETKEQGW